MFTYFKDHLAYSFLSDGPVDCANCGKHVVCHSLSDDFGDTDKTDLCFSCLNNGAAQKVDHWLNDAYPTEAVIQKHGELKARQMADTITYCTPMLPTWQGMAWPILDGDFCRFIKLASQADFANAEDLHACVPEDELFGHGPQDLWEIIPEKPITSLKDGNYDISFYLFESKNKKLVLWDAS